MKKPFIMPAILIILALVAIFAVIKRPNSSSKSQTDTKSTTNSTNSPMPKTYTEAPKMTLDTSKKYSAVMRTDLGDITIDLDVKDTPITVNNFVFLAKNNFYTNTIFHRIITGFMIQGGDPLGNGMGGPGYSFDDEPVTKEYTRGTIAMANSGPNTNGSQFFIMHADYPLPKDYVIFGKVTKGLDVVDKIATADVRLSQSGENSQPTSPVKILSITINEQ